jgi:hypothetical protein
MLAEGACSPSLSVVSKILILLSVLMLTSLFPFGGLWKNCAAGLFNSLPQVETPQKQKKLPPPTGAKAFGFAVPP